MESEGTVVGNFSPTRHVRARHTLEKCGKCPFCRILNHLHHNVIFKPLAIQTGLLYEKINWESFGKVRNIEVFIISIGLRSFIVEERSTKTYILEANAKGCQSKEVIKNLMNNSNTNFYRIQQPTFITNLQLS